ncbi:hypothetical protein ACFWMT_23135 [Streptomyces sp. NPDC058368]|uniref:hypothetical protein n=1 Tax=Streptomyces sp. NPDC058368 TaxID=3346461 RepID=UPI0036642BE4
MPHSINKRIQQQVGPLLYLPKKAAPLRMTGNRPALDPTDRGQLAFQALLFGCLASTREQPHALEQPRKGALASINGYLNCIVHRPDTLEIHTNTAYRIASRLLPFHHDDYGLCGIPGLRLVNYTCRRARLIHLPTGARLDLIDSCSWSGMKIAKEIFEQETSWHHDNGRSPLWSHPHMTAEETAHRKLWAYTASTPLRSALLMRSMPLWYRFDLTPVWTAGHGTRPAQLAWFSQPKTGHDQVVSLLTESEARIPGARYSPRTPQRGFLELNGFSALLLGA